MADAREDMGHAALVLFLGGRAAGIFGDHQIKAQLPRVAGGRLHADVGGNAAQDDGVDAATAELQLEIGTVKSAPLAFGHFNIAVAFAECGRVRPPVFRQGACRNLGINGLF